MRTARLLLVATLSLAPLPAPPARAEPVCDRVISIGDLHGAYDAFVIFLRQLSLIDGENHWTDPRACLVQLGDALDRGGRPRLILELLMDLEHQVPGRVEMLLGNHEVMNLVGDFRYLDPAELEDFAAEETPEERSAGFREYERSPFATGQVENDRKEFDARYPPGWFAHRRAFSLGGRYGSWLLERPVMKVVDGTLYVHAGITEKTAQQGVRKVGEVIVGEVRDYVRLRSRLDALGMLDPLVPFSEAFPAVAAELQKIDPATQDPGARERIDVAGSFLRLADAEFADADGPLWTRTLATEDADRLAATLPAILAKVGASRVVAGHTTNKDGRIRSRLDDRVFLIDTGAGPAFGGSISALEVRWDGRIEASYPSKSEVIAEPSLPDAEIERFLSQGRVIESKEIGSGISHPKKLVLELDGRTMKAAFKTVDIWEARPIRLERSGFDMQFSDSYRNERSAYLLDRALGMDMAPTTVLRTLDGTPGALEAWIPDAINENERKERNLEPQDPLILSRQQDVMHVFDALIANTDRNLSNQLITVSDWKLHLIDHSRSFRLNRDLPEAYRDEPSSLPRSMLDRLQALDEKKLEELLKGLVSKQQIKALLARRDAIVAKVELDRKKYGDAMVFFDLPVRAAKPAAKP